MADPQLLSTDPNAIDAPLGAHPEAKIGPDPNAARTRDNQVTLQDFEDDPMAALKHMGRLMGKDLTDPKTILPIIAGAVLGHAMGAAPEGSTAPETPGGSVVSGLKSAAGAVKPKDVGIISPRLGYLMDFAQRVKAAYQGATKAPETPAPVATPQPAAPVQAAPAAPTPVQAPPPVPMPQPSPMAGPVGQAIDMGEGLGAEQAVQAQQAPPQPAAQPAAAGVKPMSPAQTLNEMAIAARRAKITLSADDYKAGIHAVQQGASPQQAVDGIARLRSAGPSTPPTAAESTPPSTVPPAPKVRATAAEVAQFQRLKAAGKSDAEARAAVEQMRALAARLGTTSDAAVQAAVKTRNQTGDWETNP